MWNNLKLILKKLFKYYIVYVLFTGVLIFAVNIPKVRKGDSPNFNSSSKNYIDRACVIDESFYSGVVRLNLIEQAEKTIDISYYTLLRGGSTDLIFTKLVDASNRGVKVRILLDGIFNNMRGKFKNSLYMLSMQDNIEIKFYEPLNILKPWTLNNRLHDKIILVDGKLALIGGRNIGDKYFLDESEDINLVRDRDALIYNDTESENSIINTMENYYDYLWQHKYSKLPVENINVRNKKKANKYEEECRRSSEKIEKKYNRRFEEKIDWKEITEDVKGIEFVHNPIERFNKEPWALRRLLELGEKSVDSILVQSPYIILSRSMKKELNNYEIDYKLTDILTNSYKSTPNLPAISGYHNNRKMIVDKVNIVNEYQGEDSIHGKSYIFDNSKSVIGSFNLDPRSAYLSTESYVVIDDIELTKDLKSNMENYIENSLKIGKDYKYLDNSKVKDEGVAFGKLLLIKILSKLIYFFDYLL